MAKKKESLELYTWADSEKVRAGVQSSCKAVCGPRALSSRELLGLGKWVKIGLRVSSPWRRRGRIMALS